jgi:hypothetical protein
MHSPSTRMLYLQPMMIMTQCETLYESRWQIQCTKLHPRLEAKSLQQIGILGSARHGWFNRHTDHITDVSQGTVANMAPYAISSSLILVIHDNMIIRTNLIVLACLCRHF